jgi:hypothetical protein
MPEPIVPDYSYTSLFVPKRSRLFQTLPHIFWRITATVTDFRHFLCVISAGMAGMGMGATACELKTGLTETGFS